MNRKDWEFLALLGIPLSLLPIFPEPFYHRYHVNFWEWATREIYEVIYGEQARARLRQLQLEGKI